jgi:hypothetical protein
VLRARWFCKIWGSLENRERGSVQSCAAASTLADAVKRAMLAATRASTAVTILTVGLGEGEVASFRDEEELYRVMRRVMKTFWMVRKRFSPYVEKGKAFRQEYVSVMAYEDVSRM